MKGACSPEPPLPDVRYVKTPLVWRGGPCHGEDNYEVLTEFLGYDADRIADLAAAEVLA